MRWIVSLCVAVLSSTASAGVVIVPDNFPDVQSAIDAVSDGDEVHVRAGTWNGTVNFRGKSIRVLGLDGPALTTLDAQGAGTTVTFDNGELPQAILEGFTITGGTGTLVGSDTFGGGIRTDFSSPTLLNLIVEGNEADYGGGVAVHISSGPIMEDCIIRNNAALVGDGGGLYHHDSGLFLRRCEITDNDLFGYPDVRGAGIYVGGKSLGWIEDNTISGNRLTSGAGAGICIESPAAVVVIHNRIEDNGGGLVPVSWCDGAGIASFGASPCIIGNVIQDNFSQSDYPSTYGGGIYASGGVVRIINNVIHGNTCDGSLGVGIGGGIFIDVNTLTAIEGCTIVGNDADQAGAIAVKNGALATSVLNSIVYGNTAAVSPEVQDHSGLLTMNWCDVHGGFPGTGNFDLPPLFVDDAQDDFRLQANSPCLDGGDPASNVLPGEDRDADGNSRLLDGDLDGSLRHDVGAYEYTHVRLDVTGTFEVGQQVQIDVTGTTGLATFMLVGADPGQPLPNNYGFLFVQPGPGWVRPWPAAPSSVNATIPNGLTLPFEVMMQAWVLNAVSGNLSNPVRVTVEE